MGERLIKEDFVEKYCKNCGTQRCEGVDSYWFDGCKYKQFLYTDGCKDLFYYLGGNPAFCPFTGRQCKTLCIFANKVDGKEHEYKCAFSNKILMTKDFFGFAHKHRSKEIDMMKHQWSSEC